MVVSRRETSYSDLLVNFKIKGVKLFLNLENGKVV